MFPHSFGARASQGDFVKNMDMELSARIRGMATIRLVLCVIAAMALACGAVGGFAQSAASDPVAGVWKGVLAGKLHIEVTITKLSNGDYSGQVNSVDQGAVFPVEAVKLDGKKLHFEVKAIGGVYEGLVNDAGTEVQGTWTQTNAPGQPLNLTRSTDTAPAQGAAAASGPKEKPFIVPLDVVVPIAPRPFLAGGKTHLVYELHIVNMSQWNCLLTKVEVLAGGAGGASLASYAGANLEGLLRNPGITAAEKAKLAPGTEAIVYLWITPDGNVPKELEHKISVKLGDYPEELNVEMAPLKVASGVPVITSPLEGDHWFAANGPSNTSGHRRALIPIDAKAQIAQRFAIDWVKVGDDGQTYHGDKLDNKNYYAYGVNAYAVADGVVTEVKDGIPQNVPGEKSRAVPITLETVGGNHVIIDIGNGCFAFYAHLQPGSLRVKLGDKVRRGQVVGLVGNSGNSTEPHLHFHVSNASSPLGSEGLPYQLSFDLVGHGEGWKPSGSDKADKRSNEIPQENDVVNFAAAVGKK
jgi:murein DD-endopeptidase MepM/ murein hydrolase activator NlpD